MNFKNSAISKDVDGGGTGEGGGGLSGTNYQSVSRQRQSALGIPVIRFRKLEPGILHPVRTECRKIRI